MTETNGTAGPTNSVTPGKKYVLSPVESFNLFNWLSMRRDQIWNERMTYAEVAALAAKELGLPLVHGHVERRMRDLNIPLNSPLSKAVRDAEPAAEKERKARKARSYRSVRELNVKVAALEERLAQTAPADDARLAALENHFLALEERFTQHSHAQLGVIAEKLPDIDRLQAAVDALAADVARLQADVPPATADAIGAVDKTVSTLARRLDNLNALFIDWASRTKGIDTDLGKCISRVARVDADLEKLTKRLPK